MRWLRDAAPWASAALGLLLASGLVYAWGEHATPGGSTISTSAGFKAGAGGVATPGYCFTDDGSNDCLYRSAADEVSLSTAGVQRVKVDSAGKLSALGAVDVSGTLTSSVASGSDAFATSNAGACVALGGLRIQGGSQFSFGSSCGGATASLSIGGLAASGTTTSTVASGSNGYGCANIGCRLHLGNGARYFDDTGSALRFTGNLTGAGNVTANDYTGILDVAGSLGTRYIMNSTGGAAVLITDADGVVIGDGAGTEADGALSAGAISGAAGTFTGSLKAGSTLTRGTITLAAGTGTATVLSGAVCVCSNTAATNAVYCSVASTTLTATGTGTDVIAYVCL